MKNVHYQHLIEENSRRTREEPEYELIDTGIFAENRYFDVFVDFDVVLYVYVVFDFYLDLGFGYLFDFFFPSWLFMSRLRRTEAKHRKEFNLFR